MSDPREESAAYKAHRQAEERIKMNTMTFLLWFALFIGGWCVAIEIAAHVNGKPSPYGLFGGNTEEKKGAEKPMQRPLIESEKEMVSLGIGTIQEVAKAKCGLTIVGISFKNKEGVTFGAIAGEGEWSKGDMCRLIMLKYSSHSAFPSSPEYVAVKVNVDGHP